MPTPPEPYGTVTDLYGHKWIDTDYSCYSLDDIWASVNQTDNQTWQQIDTWTHMAQTCSEQAGQLEIALAQLMHRWVPTPGSAAEAFAQTVNDLITSMQRDASDATVMPGVLANVIEELSSVKQDVQTLVDQQNHYAAMEQAQHIGATADRGARPSTSGGSVPAGWRDTLRAQAVTLMRTTDKNLGHISRTMPVLTETTLFGSDSPHPPQGGGTAARPGASGITALQVGLLGSPTSSVLPLIASSLPLSEGTMLAGAPVPAGMGFGPVTGPLGVTPGWQPGNLGILPPPHNQDTGQGAQQVGVVIGNPGPTGGGTMSGSSMEADSSSAVRSNRPMMPPPATGQMRPSPTRSAIRPGGKAALWASQRQQQNATKNDPWAVRKGVPEIVLPDEPPDHDPGPGVIGIDR
jgi:hypothetical protein